MYLKESCSKVLTIFEKITKVKNESKIIFGNSIVLANIENARQLQLLLAQFNMNDGLRKERVEIKKQKRRKKLFFFIINDFENKPRFMEESNQYKKPFFTDMWYTII
jgi:hypothetical protein